MNGRVESEKIIISYDWKDYVFKAVVLGLGVMLPLGILFLALQFILGIAATITQPLTGLMGFSPEDEGLLLGLFSGFILVLSLFIVGVTVSSKVGRYNFLSFEKRS